MIKWPESVQQYHQEGQWHADEVCTMLYSRKLHVGQTGPEGGQAVGTLSRQMKQQHQTAQDGQLFSSAKKYTRQLVLLRVTDYCMQCQQSAAETPAGLAITA